MTNVQSKLVAVLISDVVNRLAIQYGFDNNEALEYVKSKMDMYSMIPTPKNTQMLTSEQLNKLYNELVLYYRETYDSLEGETRGGKLRAERGDITEGIVDIVCNFLKNELNMNVECRVGDNDKQTINCQGYSKLHQVDRHIYLNGLLKLVIECKAYLDSCYYGRACQDFKRMRLAHKDVKTAVLALENSIADDTFAFTNAEFDDVCDKVSYLCMGKRSSTKPMYEKRYRKDLQIEDVSDFVEFVYNSLC